MIEEPKLVSVTSSQRRALAYTTVAAILVGVFFLRDFLMLIALGAIVAYLFRPVYDWLIAHKMKSGAASTLTFLITLLFIVIPFTIVAIVTVEQLQHLVDTARSGSTVSDLGNAGSSLLKSYNEAVSSFGSNYQFTEKEVLDGITKGIESFGSSALDKVINSVAGIFGLITSFIIYIFVFLSILKNQRKITDLLGTMNPLGEEITDVYLKRMGSMTKAMVRGQFIIALLQGFISALVLSIAGLPDLFFFFFLVLSVLSVIPLGGGIVTIPIGIVMILFGNVWQGIAVILNHLVIVTNIDNVLKPRLVPSDARLDPALTILSVFAGIGMFGFIGIILGPVLMIVIVTTIQLFLEVFKQIDALKNEKKKKSKNILDYFGSRRKTAK